MFSVSPAELVTIAVVALLVFGPRRLPEISRKAGRILRDLRAAADTLKADFEQEYQDSLSSLDDARREMRSLGADVDSALRDPGASDDDRAGESGSP